MRASYNCTKFAVLSESPPFFLTKQACSCKHSVTLQSSEKVDLGSFFDQRSHCFCGGVDFWRYLLCHPRILSN